MGVVSEVSATNRKKDDLPISFLSALYYLKDPSNKLKESWQIDSIINQTSVSSGLLAYQEDCRPLHRIPGPFSCAHQLL